MAASNRRKSERVVFERGIDAFIMGIDGTWRRECFMEDVSQTGTKLTTRGYTLKNSFFCYHPPAWLTAAASWLGSMAIRSAQNS